MLDAYMRRHPRVFIRTNSQTRWWIGRFAGQIPDRCGWEYIINGVFFHTAYPEFACSLLTSPKSHCILHDVFRVFVPEPHERTPVTGINILYLLFPFLPLIYMGYLARRPDTFTLRLLLLPLVVAVAVGIYFRFMWTEPHHNIYNWGQGKVTALPSYL